ncbi:MAG: GntP family permease [Spirochaetaceae bacterium]|nr:GntP family permease [Spirochaetaceae bacterium]
MVSGALAFLWLLIAVALIHVLTGRYKLNAFPVLLCAALAYGLVIGLSPQEVLVGIGNGFGGTMTNIGIIMILAAMTGTILEKTGATTSMAQAILKIAGRKNTAQVMNLLGFMVSVPVYCDAGYLILSPVNKAVSRRSTVPLSTMSVALAAGMYASNALLIPTVAPLASAQALSANLGKVFLIGLVAAIPASLCGLLWARKSTAKMRPSDLRTRDSAPSHYAAAAGHEAIEGDALPGLWARRPWASFVPVFVPLLLIALKALASYPSHPLGNGSIMHCALFLGDPIMAMLLGFGCSLLLTKQGPDRNSLNRWIEEGLGKVTPMLVVTAVSGAFAQIIKAGPLIDFITTNFGAVQSTGKLVGLALLFLTAALLKTIQGSSLVAVILVSGVAAPLLPAFRLDPALAVTAVGAGSMVVSHVNDPFFWILQQSSGMDIRQTSKSWSVATAIEGCVAFLVVCLLSLFIK